MKEKEKEVEKKAARRRKSIKRSVAFSFGALVRGRSGCFRLAGGLLASADSVVKVEYTAEIVASRLANQGRPLTMTQRQWR